MTPFGVEGLKERAALRMRSVSLLLGYKQVAAYQRTERAGVLNKVRLIVQKCGAGGR